MSKKILTTFICDICQKEAKEGDSYLPDFWSRIKIQEYSKETHFGEKTIDTLYICPDCKEEKNKHKIKETYFEKIKRWF